MDNPLTERVLALVPHNYMPFGVLADKAHATPDEVKKALDTLVTEGEVELVYGRGYRLTPKPIEVRWADLKITDIDSGAALGSSETRYLVVAGDFTGWYVHYSTDTMSGADWETADYPPQYQPAPSHVTVTDLPADVISRAWGIEDDGATTAPLDDVIAVLQEDVDDVYWDAWRERVASVEADLKDDLLPFTPKEN